MRKELCGVQPGGFSLIMIEYVPQDLGMAVLDMRQRIKDDHHHDGCQNIYQERLLAGIREGQGHLPVIVHFGFYCMFLNVGNQQITWKPHQYYVQCLYLKHFQGFQCFWFTNGNQNLNGNWNLNWCFADAMGQHVNIDRLGFNHFIPRAILKCLTPFVTDYGVDM